MRFWSKGLIRGCLQNQNWGCFDLKIKTVELFFCNRWSCATSLSADIYRPHPKDDGRLYFHFVCQSTPGGGYQVSDFRGGGVPGLRFRGGGYQVSDFRGGGGYLVSVKGKLFDTRFGLIHVQTGQKIFVKGPPPPPRNSKKLLWLHGGRYASCVHAGGLSCYEDGYCYVEISVHF